MSGPPRNDWPSLAGTALGGPLPVGIRAWDGSRAGPADGPILVLANRRALRRLLYAPGELGLAEAYVSGDLDVDGDLADGLSRVWSAYRSGGLRRPRPAEYPRLVAGAVRLGIVGPSAAGARCGGPAARAAGTPVTGTGRPSRTTTTCRTSSTSCCSTTPWPTPARTSPRCPSGRPDEAALAAAQRAKLDLICRKLGLGPGKRHLDIGCGWGSLLCHAAEHYGTESTGVTLSRAQYEFVSKRIADAGLGDRATVRLADYRELQGSLADSDRVRRGVHDRDGRARRRSRVPRVRARSCTTCCGPAAARWCSRCPAARPPPAAELSSRPTSRRTCT